MHYRALRPQRPEAAGRCRSGCGTTSATRTPLDAAARAAAHGVRPRHHPFRPRQQLRPAARQRGGQLRPPAARGLRRPPRRADHLDQGRLRHVARPLRRRAAARASTCWPASTRACAAWASTTSTSSIRTASTPTRRSRRPMGALATAVQQGKALYVGISSYSRGARRPRWRRCCASWRVPLLIHQPSYNLLNRWIERRAAGHARREGIGCIAFTRARAGPADRQVPERRAGRRAHQPAGRRPLQQRASQRGEPRARARAQRASRSGAARRLAQMALAWVLRDPRVTSGADRRQQRRQQLARTSPRSRTCDFRPHELAEIDRHAQDGGLDLWERSSTDQAF